MPLVAIVMSMALGLLSALQAAPAPGAPIDTPEALMDATKRVTDDLDRMAFEIQYTKLFLIADSMEVRRGRAVVLTDARPPAQRAANPEAPPRRAFGLRFDKLWIDQRVQDEPRELIFDGEWLVERIPDEQLLIRRQLAPPGEAIDAFRLGEGPFIVLVGQDKADVLARFTASIPEDAGEGLAEHDNDNIAGVLAPQARDTVQLHLRIRPELADVSELQEVRIWYDRATLLPKLALQVDASGDESIVQLIKIRQDAEVLDAELALIDTNLPTPAGWDEQVHRFRERADAIQPAPAGE